MSLPSYRMEAPRPRPPPLPLRTRNLKSPQPENRDSYNPLLYDASPTVPKSPSGTISPTRLRSPTSPTMRSRSRTGGRTPPHSRPRSITPSQPGRNELGEFAEHCRAWYFEQDDDAGRLMTQTLATLPPSQRAPFARLQASIRSAYHASVNARRDAEFKAHLSATHPGCSLMPHSRADPNGQLAKKERYDRLERFVKTWCTTGMPGTKPTFGGAGGYRIEWEIDDAVFKEAAGKDFMLEAIDVLKGVLAFEETPSGRRSTSQSESVHYSAFAPLSTIHSRSQSQPLPADISVALSQKAPPITSTTQTKRSRPRAPSDPFLDTPTLSTSYSSANTIAHLSTSGTTLADEPNSPSSPVVEGDDYFPPMSTGLELPESDGFMRTWAAPDLSNPEYISLLSVFPPFITHKALPRFPVQPKARRSADLEEGDESQDEQKRIRVGTGTMWVGPKFRSPGWNGGWWTRFRLWLRGIFC
ncbi:uncharacterized protein B0H18DRAFT_1082280 [Fomitopsis serialis]|uniref:uncharacterized protein n=1 Tax=Fomitopsis serialis TaxID=139415 RepID=UPI0020078CC8|nr:uncharacterized protein B0H18DRAFT_1082280 [Neoantrodia serialis]KAH9935529.1 hypothetical protein B0H18DRAFT_1082280 [Neoantrodia serialis]